MVIRIARDKMRKIYSCIDVGSHSIKLVVMEKLKDRFVVLSRFIVKTKGMQRGIISNEEELSTAIGKIMRQAQEDLGISIQEVLCLIPCDMAEFSMVSGEISLNGPIGRNGIAGVLNQAIQGRGDVNSVMIDVCPVCYQVDDRDGIKDVRGLEGTRLLVKAVAMTAPKSYVGQYFSVFKKLGITIVDIGFGLVGDYYAARDNMLVDSTAAVINVGYDRTEVGIFNKGILIKTAKIDIGSRFVDKDIAYVYHLEKKKVRYLKETFAVANTRYADVQDTVTIPDSTGNMLVINQLKISEIVEARLAEILKFAKKQINILTNREIRYIIVTGGISELAGFEYVLENVFGRCASVLNMDKMGVRSNSYSSCVGFIEYFSEKLELRDKAYSMIKEKDVEAMSKKYKKEAGDGGLGGILNYLTGNKED